MADLEFLRIRFFSIGTMSVKKVYIVLKVFSTNIIALFCIYIEHIFLNSCLAFIGCVIVKYCWILRKYMAIGFTNHLYIPDEKIDQRVSFIAKLPNK